MKKTLILFLIFFVKICYSQYPVFNEQNSGVNVQLNSASKPLITFNYYFGYTIGWACGNSGMVIRTTTYGTSWSNVGGNGIPSSANLYSICALDSGHALVGGIVGSTAFIWRTSNLGSNWVQVFSQPGGFVNSILFKNANTGFMVGNPAGSRWSLWKSINAGLSWDSSGLFLPESGNETGWNNSFFIDTNRLWFGTNNYRIYYSSNFGITWSVQSTGSEQNIYSINFNNIYNISKTGFAGGSNLIKTSNNGLNWISVASLGSGNISGITSLYSYPTPYVMYSRGNKIYFSSNYGSNWNDIYTAPSGNYTAVANYAMDWYHYQLFFVRTNGGISVSNIWEGIKKIASDVPDKFSLSQNYPNPFNPSTKIRFNLPVPSEGGVTLTIYDVLGRKVAELIPPPGGGQEGPFQPGTYEVEWDGANYPSGVYFYKLIIDKYTESKKMILLK